MQGRRAIASLDAIVSHLILGDERLEREWRSAKRIRRSTTERTETGDEEETSVVAGTIAPVVPTAQEVKQAAA